MKANKNAVQAKIRKISDSTGVSANVLLASFFFDAFLSRLAKSEFKDDFIFKGGFYLATLLGIQNRYTQDMDFKLSGQNLEEERIKSIIGEIISIRQDDNVTFEFSSISPIRDEDQYGGFSVSLTARLENIRQTVGIDIATGDPITPGAVTYRYKRIFDEGTIDFMAYNLETFLAEKLQTVFKRGVLNSRCKDFYDIYIISRLRRNELSEENLRQAFKNTCDYRNTRFSKDDSLKTLSNLRKDSQCLSRWKNYARKNPFAQGVSFGETLDSCEEFAGVIFAE